MTSNLLLCFPVSYYIMHIHKKEKWNEKKRKEQKENQKKNITTGI